MPPLAFTQSKYARALSVISSQLMPVATVTIAPMLIGLPVAFLPLPRPQTLFVGEAFPEPTGPADVRELDPAAYAAIASAAPRSASGMAAFRSFIVAPFVER